MNVELKFKPGIRTSLNSNNNIRDNFGSTNNNSGGVKQARNSTASSAAQNLSQMSLVSGNWNSKSGSILNTGASNVRFGAASTTTSPRQGSAIDPNYVSAGRSRAYVRDRYSSIQDFGYTRAENMSGYSGRGLQRLQDAAYGQGAYAEFNPYAQLNATSHVHSSNSADVVSTITTAAKTGKVKGKALFDLGKNVWDAFSSSKDSKASVSGGGTVSDSASANLKAMKDANNSSTLASSIDNAKADLQTTEASISAMKESLAKAQSERPGLETAFNDAQTAFTNLDTQVKAQQEIVNQNTAALPAAQSSYESAKSAYEAAPAEPPEYKAQLKEAMESAKAKLDEIQSKIDEANQQLETLQPQLTEAKGKMDDAKQALDANQKTIDETPAKIKDSEATVAAYKKEIPNQEKRLDEMQKKEDKEFAKLYENGVKGKNNDKDKARLKDLSSTIANRNPEDSNTTETINGKEFTEIKDANGNSKFMIDGEVVTEKEFMAAKQESETIAQDLTADRPDSEINFA